MALSANAGAYPYSGQLSTSTSTITQPITFKLMPYINSISTTPYINGTPYILNSGWTFTAMLGPGEWLCRGCGHQFYILDDQPLIEERTEYLDVTTFGQTTPSYITQVIKELFCSTCRP